MRRQTSQAQLSQAAAAPASSSSLTGERSAARRLLSSLGARLLSGSSSSLRTEEATTKHEARPLLPTVVGGKKNGGGYSSSSQGNEPTGTATATATKPPKRNKKRLPLPRFLVLDFRRVTAVDMSSVVNCWLPLQSLCRDLGVVLVYAHCNLRVEFYLRGNRLIDDTNTHLLPTLHQALDFCETALLQVKASA